MSQPDETGFIPPDDVVFEPDEPVIDSGEAANPDKVTEETAIKPPSKRIVGSPGTELEFAL